MHALNQCKVVAPEFLVWQKPACQLPYKHKSRTVNSHVYLLPLMCHNRRQLFAVEGLLEVIVQLQNDNLTMLGFLNVKDDAHIVPVILSTC